MLVPFPEHIAGEHTQLNGACACIPILFLSVAQLGNPDFWITTKYFFSFFLSRGNDILSIEACIVDGEGFKHPKSIIICKLNSYYAVAVEAVPVAAWFVGKCLKTGRKHKFHSCVTPTFMQPA